MPNVTAVHISAFRIGETHDLTRIHLTNDTGCCLTNTFLPHLQAQVSGVSLLSLCWQELRYPMLPGFTAVVIFVVYFLASSFSLLGLAHVSSRSSRNATRVRTSGRYSFPHSIFFSCHFRNQLPRRMSCLAFISFGPCLSKPFPVCHTSSSSGQNALCRPLYWGTCIYIPKKPSFKNQVLQSSSA